jgi:hypothetical protein
MAVVTDAVLARLADEPDEMAQALCLLRASGIPDAEELTLGAGDRRLLDLHRAVTADDIETTVICAGCDTANTVTIGPGSVAPASPRSAWWGPAGGLREPVYRDLLDLPDDPDGAVEELLSRCTVGQPARPATPVELAAADDSLAGPVRLACVGCGQPIELELDVQRAVISRLVAWGRSVDTEVHLLASTYHWDLATIEALPDRRRRRLAELIREGR